MPPKKDTVTSLALNEKILCNAGGFFYEAKVIDILENPRRYRVHYQGWHKRYDEDIAADALEDKVKAFTDEALAEAKEELKKKKESLQKKKSRKSGVDDMKGSGSRDSTPSENADGSKAPSMASEKTSKARSTTKRKADSMAPESGADTYPMRNDTKLHLFLPSELKNVLIEDNDLINRQNMLYSLPAKHTVEMIIDNYCKEFGSEKSELDQVIIEYDDGKTASEDAMQIILSTRGLQDYFDCLLPFQLLYKFEKQQYSDVIDKKRDIDPSLKKKGKSVSGAKSTTAADVGEPSPSKYYGLPHLLRLLTRFEYLLKLSVFNERVSASIAKCVSDFTVWLGKNKEVYFNSQEDYEVAPPAYQRETFA